MPSLVYIRPTETGQYRVLTGYALIPTMDWGLVNSLKEAKVLKRRALAWLNGEAR